MLRISQYIEAIYKAINQAIDEGFNCTDNEGLIDLNRVNESISLRAWVDIRDIDEDLWNAAIAAFKAQLDFEDKHFS